MAALSGLNPWRFTIRELNYAAENKVRAQWDQTAELLAMQANLNAQGRFSRDDFHPMRKAKLKKQADPAKIYRELVAKKNGRNI